MKKQTEVQKLQSQMKKWSVEELEAYEWNMHNEVAVSARCSDKIYQNALAKRTLVREELQRRGVK